MKRYEHLREKAIEIRKEGYSLSLICEMLSLSKSTVYYWIKGVEIDRIKCGTDGRKYGNKGTTLKYKKLRDNAYNSFHVKADELLKDKYLRDFIIIYLTEGYRRNRNIVSVSNSNGKIILLSHYWMLKLSNRKINYKLTIHVDNDEIEVKKYWANLLNISPDRIKIYNKSNSGKLNKRKWRSMRGVMNIGVCDTYLRSKIQALMDYLEREWVDVF